MSLQRTQRRSPLSRGPAKPAASPSRSHFHQRGGLGPDVRAGETAQRDLGALKKPGEGLTLRGGRFPALP